MKDILYEYDGSFDGFLCCVYESYTQKENPTGFPAGEEVCTLFDTRYIPTVKAHAQRVYRSFFKTSQRHELILVLLSQCTTEELCK